MIRKIRNFGAFVYMYKLKNAERTKARHVNAVEPNSKLWSPFGNYVCGSGCANDREEISKRRKRHCTVYPEHKIKRKTMSRAYQPRKIHQSINWNEKSKKK